MSTGVDTKINKGLSAFSVDWTDLKGLKQMLANRALYEDIFLVITWTLLIAFIGLLLFAYFGDATIHPKFISWFGYLMVIAIFIYTAVRMYSKLARDLQTPCKPSVVLETHTKFHVLLSFAYYYIQTYIAAIINIAIVFLCIYLVYYAMRTNIIFDKRLGPWLTTSESKFYKVLIYIYLAISLIVLLILTSFIIANLVDKGDNVKLFISKDKQAFMVVLYILCIIGMLYWVEMLSHTIAVHVRKQRDNKSMQALFGHTELFSITNLADPQAGHDHLSIFLRGLEIALVYAFVLLPKVNLTLLCKMRDGKVTPPKDEEDEEDDDVAQEDVKQQYEKFSKRFLFGYFLMTMIVVWLHLLTAFQMVINKEAI